MGRERHAYRLALITLIAVMSCMPASSRDSESRPTYDDVKPILHAACVPCHNRSPQSLGGMVAPFSLETYEDVKPRYADIGRAVASGRMPPWNVAPEFHGTFENERLLATEQVRTIAAWVEDGGPRGLNDPEAITTTVTLGENRAAAPDLVLPLPREVVLDGQHADHYEYFTIVLTADLLRSDRWLRAIEFRPGSRAVHHASLIANNRLLGAVAPGYQRREYPAGYADLIRVGDTLSIEVHYYKEPSAAPVRDQSGIAMYFYQQGDRISHVVETETLGVWEFTIPARAESHSDSASYVFEGDYYILWLTPHMHWRGKSVSFRVDYPDGTQRELLRVPRYDFNWQHTYRYRAPVFVPRGTKVTVLLEWDNSAGNPANPDPSVNVGYGPRSSDEMGVGLLLITEARKRNIIAGEPLPNDLPPPRPVMRNVSHHPTSPPAK